MSETMRIAWKFHSKWGRTREILPESRCSELRIGPQEPSGRDALEAIQDLPIHRALKHLVLPRAATEPVHGAYEATKGL